MPLPQMSIAVPFEQKSWFLFGFCLNIDAKIVSNCLVRFCLINGPPYRHQGRPRNRENLKQKQKRCYIRMHPIRATIPVWVLQLTHKVIKSSFCWIHQIQIIFVGCSICCQQLFRVIEKRNVTSLTGKYCDFGFILKIIF